MNIIIYNNHIQMDIYIYNLSYLFPKLKPRTGSIRIATRFTRPAAKMHPAQPGGRKVTTQTFPKGGILQGFNKKHGVTFEGNKKMQVEICDIEHFEC